MENLTLTRDELNTLLKAFAIVFLCFEIILALTLWHFNSSALSAVIRSLSPALLCASALFYIFFRWAWSVGPVAQWMGRPVVRGVWLGYLNSDYKKTSADSSVALPIVFIVRQTYLTISIRSLTQRQIGESRVEALIRNKRTDTTQLAYVFELKNTYPGQRVVTSGAGELQLISNGSVLEGAYWTNSPTHGTLKLRLQSSDCSGVQTFEEATKRWPIGPLWKF